MTPSISNILDRLTDAQRLPVPGYEGRYAVDSEGAVYSLPRTFKRDVRGSRSRHPHMVGVPGRKLAQNLNRNGYLIVRLSADGRMKTFEVHRLVCRVFHGEPAAGQEVAHCNGIKTDNRAANLRWATRSENARDKSRHGTMLTGERHGRAKLTVQQAVEIFVRAKTERGADLAREFGFSHRAINKIRDGITWKAEVQSALRASEGNRS